jgi:hypothetical protein
MFKIHSLTESDYDNILTKWWADWGWEAPLKDFLPLDGTCGLIVYDNDTPVCAGFLYVTNSKVCWVDWIISNKDYRKKPQRTDALLFLIASLTEAASKTGAKFVYALIKNKPLIEKYKSLGYTEGDSYTKEMIKYL